MLNEKFIDFTVAIIRYIFIYILLQYNVVPEFYVLTMILIFIQIDFAIQSNIKLSLRYDKIRLKIQLKI